MQSWWPLLEHSKYNSGLVYILIGTPEHDQWAMEVFPHELCCQQLVTLKATLSTPANDCVLAEPGTDSSGTGRASCASHDFLFIQADSSPCSFSKDFQACLNTGLLSKRVLKIMYLELILASKKQGLKHLHSTVTNMKMLLSSPGIWQQVGSLNYFVIVDLLMYMRWKWWWSGRLTSCHPKRWDTPRKGSQAWNWREGGWAEHIPGSSDTQHHFPAQRSRNVPG